MAASKHGLREFQPLTSILQTVPQRLQKGLFSQDIEWTCLDVTKEYLAIGTNVGIVFLYDRYERTMKRLHCPGDDSSVTCVSLQNSVDYVVAMGTESAHVYIYQLPSSLPDRPKQLQMFKVENLHQVAVQCLAWSLNAMKLFSGDLGGTVVCTEIDYVEENCRSYEVCHESHTIVQLHYAYKTLLVSTLSRTLLCTVSDGHTRTVQVGQKQRKGLDAYGSTFLLGSYQAKDAILFAARPGLRIWKACGVSGVVQATFIFRDLMTDPSQGIELLPDTASDFSHGSTIDQQFGRLLLFNDTQLVTYHGTRLCVVDPGLGQFVSYHGNLGYISSIAVCKDEIFVLRKVDSGRRLLRLGFSPEITEEIQRPLGVESHTPQTTVSSTSSPVHTIVHSASAMSRGIVGALKGVGDMLHSSVEGQIVSSSTNPPPWGIVSEKNGDASALPHSESIDSAKEANPSNVPSPSSEGSVKDIVSDAMASETDQVTSHPIDKTEPEEILTVEIYETPSECPADDKTSELVSRGELVGDGATLSTCEEQVTPSTGEAMHQTRSHLPKKFLAVGDDPYEDIVFSSHTKKRKKKKTKLAVKEKDVSSMSSPEGCTTSSGDRVVSSQSHNHLLTPRDGSTAYISAQDIGRVSPSSQDTDTANLTQVSQNHEESAVVVLSENFSETSILDVNTESEKVSLQKTESGDHGNDTRAMCISEAESVPVSVAQLQTTKTCSVGVHSSALCKTELSQHAADGVSSKEHCESASHVVERSADLPQVSDEKCQTEAPDVVSVTPKDQLGGKAAGVTTVASKGQSEDTAVVTNPATDPSRPNIDLATKSWFSLNATSPAKNLQHSTATNQPDVTTIAFPSDKPNINHSHKTSSPLESPDDFYSKYRHFSCITTDSEADVSLEQMLDYSTESDENSASHEVDAMLADTWSEFLMSDKFEGLLGICMSERHLWIVDKHEVVAYSRTNKQQLNWRPVTEPAHQVAVSSSGAIVWRLFKGSVYVALRVTPTVPVGTKWNEVAREVKHIAVDDTVAWYVKTTGELMMQKGLCRERPSFRSHPVSCSHKILQVACYSGIVWVLTEQRHLLARTGIEPGREEGAAWKEVSRRSCPKAVSFDFGHENSVWVLDVSGHLWFTTGVRPLTPEGSGDWWQVSMSRYIMHDTTMLDLTHDTLRSLTSKLLGGCVNTEMTGVLTARHSGIWLWTPSNGRKMLACRGTLTGHHWQLVTPGGLPASVKWMKLSLGCVSGDKQGCVWLQLSNGDVFCFLPSSKKLIEVAPPVAQRSFSCISGTRDAFWGLLADGGVYIRAGIGGRCVQGRSWSQQTMIQLGDAHLVSVSCGTQNVIVVDNTGQVYLRIGVKAPEKHHLCPAWVPIDGTTSMAGSKFTSIYTNPADWLVWALDSKNSVYVRKGITDDLPIGTHWLYVPGVQASSLCISNEFVYALTPGGKIYVRYAITSTNPAGNYWKEIPGHFVAFAVTANDDLWALDESGQLHRRTIQHIHCDQYTRVKASGSVDEGWELI